MHWNVMLGHTVLYPHGFSTRLSHFLPLAMNH